jgi:hypothetical protein
VAKRGMRMRGTWRGMAAHAQTALQRTGTHVEARPRGHLQCGGHVDSTLGRAHMRSK